ncbi:selenoprotein domain-containing protein [Metarhizium album ARSEF 1941]|uniref:Selenoprotein domain-containing protein n=1 Tax=Metarhizium album (strain ARSEF 1941) TaxID=1081103 RepID=A0A0B2X2Q7_METAS|nr:selenoprotein domain-containing protein [Metarhizium album ARSEF 1941]KHN99560.1 selenoprotein domain-containing protein [Metarhizium album ARSEF 1941]
MAEQAEQAEQAESTSADHDGIRLPRVTIQFCTQCRWMLRAAYFAQELLSTFSTSLGEVSLQPSTGGTFAVTMRHRPLGPAQQAVSTTVLWDRKTDGGFPETKELKRRVRDVIQPGRDLGHVDGHHAAGGTGTATATATATHPSCRDCS